MTAEQLAALAGVALSLFISYFPGISKWYDGLDAIGKRGVMGLLIIAVAAGALGLSCAGVIADVECTQIGALALLNAVVAALIANQATYLLSPKSHKKG